MKSKFIESVSINIKEDLKALKGFKVTYVQMMKTDSDAQFITGSLMGQRLMINTELPKLLEDLQNLQEDSIKKDTKDFCKNIKDRCNPKAYGFVSADDMLGAFEALSVGEETSWEQGYLRGQECAHQEVINLLGGYIDKLTLLLNKY